MENNFEKETNISSDTEATTNAGVNEGRKKNKVPLNERLKDFFFKFIKIFADYPFTIGALIIASFIGAIIMDFNGSDAAEDVMVKIAFFCMMFSVGSLWTEEKLLGKSTLFGKELPRYLFRGIFLCLSAAVAAVLTYIEECDSKLIFGIDSDIVFEYTGRFFTVYLALLVVLAVYHMFKRSGKSFEDYCAGVFSQTLKVTIIYGIFAIGIALIIGIIDVLILDTYDWDVIGRLELILAGAIYAPAMLKAFSQIKDELSKFFKIVILYALFVLLLAAFAVIYIYIFKIIVLTDLPSNEVFSILAWLFALGLPVWTMAMKFKDNALGKLARFVPFIYAPFIILQIICLFMRVSDYGFTQSRYMGLILIITEIIYIAVYAVKMGRFVDKVVFLLPVMAFVVFWMPGLSMNAVCIRSQAARLDDYLARADELEDKEFSAARTAYNVIDYCGYEGERYIDEHYTENQQEVIKSWSDYYWDGNDDVRKYYSWYGQNSSDDFSQFVDISKYSQMKEVEISGYEVDSYDQVYLDNNNEVVADLTEVCEGLIEDSEFFETHNYFEIADGYVLYVNSISITETNGGPDHFWVSGYLFKR